MIFSRDKRTTTKCQHVVRLVVFVLLVIYAFLLIYPFLWGFLCSFMTEEDFYDAFGVLIPKIKTFTLENYRKALDTVVTIRTSGGLIKEYGIFDMILNTVWITILRSFIGMAFSVGTAYMISKYKFIGKNFFFYFAVVFCSIPLYGGLSSLLSLLYKLNLYDTFFALVFMSISPFANFLFYYGFFNGISWEYAEAAFIDGAGDFRVFIQIMLPQIYPVLFTFLVNSFIVNWNDWYTSYMYFPSIPMVAYGVYKVSNQIGTGEGGGWTTYFAISYLSLLVTGTFFAVFSKRILATVYTGGLKG